MSTLSLIVKGDKFQAAKAASARGIPFVFSHEVRTKLHGRTETVGKVGDQFKDVVRAWYHEENSAPFPIGTLLAWSELTRVS